MCQPLPEFETPRLFLRPYQLADVAACLEMDMDPDVVRYVGPVGTREERRIELTERATRALGPGLGIWCIFPRDEPQRFIGWVILIPLRDHHTIEVGYRLGKTDWGKGYATEATAAVISHGFETLGLREITAVTDPQNTASQRVLAKLGFASSGKEYAYGQMLPIFYLKAPQPQ